MIEDERFARLEREVAELRDRQAILDVVHRHARGHDRFDVDLLTAAYHLDGIDEHGAAAVNRGPDYAAWANAAHSGAQLHLHNITTHTCEIDGDVAHAESYVLVVLLGRDGKTAQLLNGRYIDRLEKRDGEWRIALRRCTLDIAVSADASVMQSSFIKAGGFIKGQRDSSDVSYRRPLELDEAERL